MTTVVAIVALDGDEEFEYQVKRKATTTGSPENAAALSTVSVHYSTDDGGAAIAGTPTTLTNRSGNTALYYGILDAAAKSAALTAYLDRVVFEVFMVDGVPETSEPVRVKATRRPA